jgi:nitronate monooxygenase
LTAALACPLPTVIQGGMGIGVSNWILANAVASAGQLGVVSGTAIDSLFVRRLQDGDAGGHLRRAMSHFPMPDVSADALMKYFLPDGRVDGAPYKMLSMWRQTVGRAREQVAMLASFVEVYLAREGHDGLVGINLLTKVQMPNLATLYGAMLAGVDYVLMGAGIPKEIPGVLDAFAAGEAASHRLDVEGAARPDDAAEHRPGAALRGRSHPQLRGRSSCPSSRPTRWPRCSRARRTARGRLRRRRADGRRPQRAAPRHADVRRARRAGLRRARHADLAAMRDLGLPFWLAGGTATPERVEMPPSPRVPPASRSAPCSPYCEESGLPPPEIKATVLEKVRRGDRRAH